MKRLLLMLFLVVALCNPTEDASVIQIKDSIASVLNRAMEAQLLTEDQRTKLYLSFAEEFGFNPVAAVEDGTGKVWPCNP